MNSKVLTTLLLVLYCYFTVYRTDLSSGASLTPLYTCGCAVESLIPFQGGVPLSVDPAPLLGIFRIFRTAAVCCSRSWFKDLPDCCESCRSCMASSGQGYVEVS